MKRRNKEALACIESILLHEYNRYYRLAYSYTQNEADAQDIDSLADLASFPLYVGFVLTSDGGPNIIFGVVDGKLAIRGMNY